MRGTLVSVASLVTVVALAAGACSSAAPGADDGGEVVAGAPALAGGPSDRWDPARGPSALVDPTHSDLPAPTIDLAEVRSGGPPPDGIPAIDAPRFVPAADVDWLAPNEPVLALEVDGDARAYPVQIMIWHELVNDVVGGRAVTVSYCPLCNSAIAYDRLVDGERLDFGTSGRLWRSAMVMYDRQTQSLWSHFDGRAFAGVLTGAELTTLPMTTVGWAEWVATHPDGSVLSRATGHGRDYGRNPYPGYDDVTTSPFLFEGVTDGRLAAKERVVGVGEGDTAVAVLNDLLLTAGAVEVPQGNTPLVVFKALGTGSGLDADTVAGGDEVGATAVFDRTVDGRLLSFEREPDGVRFRSDDGSHWDVFGRATSGPLTGQRLVAVPHVDTFWFAWSTFQPDTVVVGLDDL